MTPANPQVRDLKILLVEDNFEAMNLTRNMLNAIGFNQVFTARDGMQALDMLNAFDGEDFVDVVLCDWNMPRVTGMDLLKQIRSCDPDLPFMMITGMADLKAVTEARSFGVTAYIKKPFSQDELSKKMSVLERVLTHRKSA